MTDREMLELAAKAGGYARHEYVENSARDGRVVTGHYDSLLEVCINPLDDDGDALRLAVQCGIEISIVDDEPGTDGRFSRACAGYATEDDPRVRYVFEDHKGDLFSATRRAIVRAAAEIGRQMEEAK